MWHGISGSHDYGSARSKAAAYQNGTWVEIEIAYLECPQKLLRILPARKAAIISVSLIIASLMIIVAVYVLIIVLRSEATAVERRKQYRMFIAGVAFMYGNAPLLPTLLGG